MGNTFSGDSLEGGRNVGRQQAVTEGKQRRRGLPPNSVRALQEDWPVIEVRPAGPWARLPACLPAATRARSCRRLDRFLSPDARLC